MTDNSCKCCDALLDFSTNVYQKVRDLEAKEKEEYDKLLGDIKKMEKWEDLEKETREKVNETEEFFEQFQNNEPDGSLLELIKESASKLNKAFSDLLERYEKLKGTMKWIRARVEDRHNSSKTRREKIVTHAGKALLAAILLGLILGGVIGWGSPDRLPTVVWVSVGGGSVLVVGGLCYTILVGVACRNVKRWENLRGKVQELPVTDDLIEEIGTKYSTLYPIPKIFLSDIEGDETNPSDVKRVSRDLINQLRSYNEIKCK